MPGPARFWKGVPYAADTGGPNRWQKPQPRKPWAPATRDVTQYGPGCMQGHSSTNPDVPANQSEDCLNMNIWAPVNANATSKLPVMVFFHGGAYKEGCDVGPFEIYSGVSLVNNKHNPVVVVTANYRLGPFGWLSNGKNIKGNYGLWDNIAALEFVRDNIANFGGDPGRVTIWGESAGAENVGILLTSAYHAAEGLFHRAIMESNPAAFRLRGPNDNAVYAHAFCEALNCSGCALACLQVQDAEAVRGAWGKAGNAIAPIVLGNWGHWLDALLAGGPVVDGDLIRQQPNSAVLPYYPKGFAGGNANVSVLIGTNDNEGSTFIYAMARRSCPRNICCNESAAFAQLRPGFSLSLRVLQKFDRAGRRCRSCCGARSSRSFWKGSSARTMPCASSSTTPRWPPTARSRTTTRPGKAGRAGPSTGGTPASTSSRGSSRTTCSAARASSGRRPRSARRAPATASCTGTSTS